MRRARRAHFKYGVRQEHYGQLSAAVAATLQSALDQVWTEEQDAGWNAFLGTLVSIVKKAYSAGALPAHLSLIHI